MPSRFYYTEDDYQNLFAICGVFSKIATRICNRFAGWFRVKRKPSVNTVINVIGNVRYLSWVRKKFKKIKPIMGNEKFIFVIMSIFAVHFTTFIGQIA